MVYRHKKSGGLYVVMAQARIEATGEKAVVYKSISTGDVWVRPAEEFMDGRFEEVADSVAGNPVAA